MSNKELIERVRNSHGAFDRTHRDLADALKAAQQRITELEAEVEQRAWDGVWRTKGQTEDEARRVLMTWTKQQLVEFHLASWQKEIHANDFAISNLQAYAKRVEAERDHAVKIASERGWDRSELEAERDALAAELAQVTATRDAYGHEIDIANARWDAAEAALDAIRAEEMILRPVLGERSRLRVILDSAPADHLNTVRAEAWAEGRRAGMLAMADRLNGQYTLIDGASQAWGQIIGLLRRDAQLDTDPNPYRPEQGEQRNG